MGEVLQFLNRPDPSITKKDVADLKKQAKKLGFLVMKSRGESFYYASEDWKTTPMGYLVLAQVFSPNKFNAKAMPLSFCKQMAKTENARAKVMMPTCPKDECHYSAEPISI